MLPVLLGVAVAAVVLAFPFVTRRLRPGRHPAPAGAEARPVPCPYGRCHHNHPEARPHGERPEPQPRGEVTGPFGYDNGLTTGDAS